MEDKLINALCSTLVHSLWQGILLAALAGVVVTGTKKSNAALRYNLLVGALSLFATAIVLTFVLQFNSGHIIAPLPGNVYPIHTDQIIVPLRGFTESLSAYLTTYHNIIVLAWFLVICIKSIQFGMGLSGIYRLKRINIFAAGSFWENRIRKWAILLGIRQAVRLLESGLVKVPVVAGNLKPIILVPVGLLTSLNTAEVEAILIHELAHIKRRDYLVNLLQNLMEIVFFFNPAVLWVSALIKTERENCCDDLALAYTHNKESYIRALLSCEKYLTTVPYMAVAFPGTKGKLIDRIKRMAAGRNYSLNSYEKSILTIGLVLFGLCFSAFREREAIKRSVAVVVSAMHQGLRVATQPTPTLKARPIDVSKKPVTTADTMQKANLENLQTVTDTARNAYSKPYSNSYPSHRQAELADSTLRRPAQQPYSPPYERRGGYSNTEWKRRDSLANATITADLLQDGIISDDRNFDFKLSDKDFVVNGQQQSAVIFKRYRDKYVPSGAAGVGWKWNHTQRKD